MSHEPAAGCRWPTKDEAVEIVLRQLTKDARRACIAHWREGVGDSFADAVEAEVRAKWKKK